MLKLFKSPYWEQTLTKLLEGLLVSEGKRTTIL